MMMMMIAMMVMMIMMMVMIIIIILVLFITVYRMLLLLLFWLQLQGIQRSASPILPPWQLRCFRVCHGSSRCGCCPSGQDLLAPPLG